MVSRRLFLSLLLLLLLASSATAYDKYITNESEDGDAPARVNIPAFTLTLSPTFGSFSSVQEDLLEDAADVVLQEYISTQVPDGVALDFVSLINVVQDNADRRKLQQETSVMEIGGGLASFRGGETPSVDDVNKWVSAALEGPLLETLQGETEFNYVESILFTSLSPAPTPAPSVQPILFGGIQDGTQIQASEDSSGKIAASVVGALAIAGVLAAALLMVRRRKQLSRGVATKLSPTAVVVEADDASSSDEEESMQTNQNHRIFAISEVESESEWTLNSSATDAFTVKSGKVFPRSSHSILQTESFERDRQVSLKKDMMQAPWSTATSNNVQKGSGTVLQPSYFSAGHVDSYDMDENWNPDDTTETTVNPDSPFLFEGQGEEVVLMPPSRTRSSRRELI
jgi:hypothetical protein